MTDHSTTGRFLIPFCDDSTLIFGTLMRRLMQEAGAQVDLGLYKPEAVLSERQLRAYLPDLDYTLLTPDRLTQMITDGTYDAVLTSRVFRTLNELLKLPAFAIMPKRAKVIAFLGGLDFFPEKGRANRQFCDAVYLFPRPELTEFQNLVTQKRTDPGQKPLVRFGHPAFLKPRATTPEAAARRAAAGDIYFFTQAISPSTERARLHMLNVMKAIARANPDRKVWIKLRHLPDENTTHLHREKHDYPSLIRKSAADMPANLQITDCQMDVALQNAALGITCTSTAAIDLVREGVPTIVHLDYVDNYVDKLVEPMRRLFASSNLIKPLDDLLHLRHSDPDPDWMENMFCDRDLAQNVMSTMATLKSPQPSE